MQVTIMHGDPHNMGLTETGDYSPGTARKLRQKLNHLFFRAKSESSNNNLGSVIETDYLHGISEEQEETLRQKGVYTSSDHPALQLSDSSYVGVIEDVVEEEKWQSVTSLLRQQLITETTARHLELFLPGNLLERISKDIVRMSVSEPYGLRGCSLHLNLERRSSCEVTKLGTVECDWNTVSTFELHLNLIEDKKRWYSIRDLIAPVLPGCLNESQALEVFISPGFKLVKHKLYRPN